MSDHATVPAPAQIESVILVDEFDVAVGECEKLETHRNGALHRAFSVTVMNSAGEMLMQRRALCKYHSGGLWSNACCGHPRPGESVVDAAERRLREEMGIACDLTPGGAFIYRAQVTPELTEHEYDHVLFGVYDGALLPDPAEVMDWRWAHPQEELHRLTVRPELYSAWLPLVLPRAMECAVAHLSHSAGDESFAAAGANVPA